MSGTIYTRIQTEHGNIIEITRTKANDGYDVFYDGENVRHEISAKPPVEVLNDLIGIYTKDGGQVTDSR